MISIEITSPREGFYGREFGTTRTGETGVLGALIEVGDGIEFGAIDGLRSCSCVGVGVLDCTLPGSTGCRMVVLRVPVAATLPSGFPLKSGR